MTKDLTVGEQIEFVKDTIKENLRDVISTSPPREVAQKTISDLLNEQLEMFKNRGVVSPFTKTTVTVDDNDPTLYHISVTMPPFQIVPFRIYEDLPCEDKLQALRAKRKRRTRKL